MKTLLFFWCLLRGHAPVKVVETWRTLKGGVARRKWRKRRRSWIECSRCGKELQKERP